MAAGDGGITVPKLGEYRQDIVASDGLKWVIGRGTHDSLTVNHEMEPAGHSIHDYICSQFTAGRVFLDIGAHVGHYTVRAAARGCQVYAVEANPEAAAQLRLNLYLNNLSRLVTVWAVAAWDVIQPLDYAIAPGSYQLRNGSASLASPESNSEAMGVTVMGTPLDELLDRVDRVDVVKMDVEGADIHVIHGMTASLARLRPLLIFESHWFTGCYTDADMAAAEHQLTQAAGYSWQDATDLGVRSREKFRVGTPGR